MFLVRQAIVEDCTSLTKLAQMLAPSAGWGSEDVAAAIERSDDSFAGRISGALRRRFIFVLEDTETGSPVGAVSLHSCVSRPGHALVYFLMRRHRCYSDDLQTGHEHVTLQLQSDEAPRSEIARLILAPPYRGHRERPASLLTFACFHFIGLHRNWFADTLIAHLPPPRVLEQEHAFWQALGRRFVNLPLSEALRVRTASREFLPSLVPSTEIHLALLPAAVRRIVGRVAEEAVSAEALLKKAGFIDAASIDPFDGGPILHAAAGGIPIVAGTRTTTVGDPAERYPGFGLISTAGGGQFRAVGSAYAEHEHRASVSIPADTAGLLGLHVGDTVGVAPLALASVPVTPE